jgi:hypothetical protein
LGIRTAERPKQIERSDAVIQQQIPVENIGLTKNSDCSFAFDEAGHAACADRQINVVSYSGGAAGQHRAKRQ